MPKFQNNYENTPFDEEDNRLNGNGKNDFSRIPLSTEQGPKSDGAMQYKSDSGESDHLKNFLISYAFASLGIVICEIIRFILFNQKLTASVMILDTQKSQSINKFYQNYCTITICS